jgi:protein-S-isoprenylcysteine O-methyltransferase Ste14
MQRPIVVAIELWFVLFAVWVVGMFTGKRIARRESAWTRIVEMLIVVSAYELMFNGNLAIGFLGWRVLKPNVAVAWIGVALTAAGITFAFWARFTLGRNWSGTVTVKHDHELIVRGPYRIVRHPIYTGFTLAMLGTAVVIGQARGLVAVALIVVAWRFKWGIEERFMLEEFGDRYADYRKRVRALIPGIW